MELGKLLPSLRTGNSTLTPTVCENEPSPSHTMNVNGLVRDPGKDPEAGGRYMHAFGYCLRDALRPPTLRTKEITYAHIPKRRASLSIQDQKLGCLPLPPQLPLYYNPSPTCSLNKEWGVGWRMGEGC